MVPNKICKIRTRPHYKILINSNQISKTNNNIKYQLSIKGSFFFFFVKPAKDVHVVAPIAYYEEEHPPWHTYSQSLLQGKILSKHVPIKTKTISFYDQKIKEKRLKKEEEELRGLRS